MKTRITKKYDYVKKQSLEFGFLEDKPKKRGLKAPDMMTFYQCCMDEDTKIRFRHISSV